MKGTDEDQPFEDLLADRARARWDADTEALLEAEDPGDPDDDDALIEGALDKLAAQADAPEPASVVPLSSRRAWIAGVASLAAVVVAVVLLRPAAAPPLPAFEERAFEGGISEIRGDDGAVPPDATFLPGTRIRWAFAPDTAVDEPVALRIRATGPTSRCITVQHGQRLASTGAIEVEGRITDVLGLEPGHWTLTALVAHRSTMEGLDDPCLVDPDSGAYPDGVVAVATRSVLLLRSR